MLRREGAAGWGVLMGVMVAAAAALVFGLTPARGEESTAAADALPDRLALALERVVVFKDGYGLFVKSAKATADDKGEVFTEEVPDGAILGCFWAVSEDPPVRAMRSEWIERTEDRETDVTCLTLRDLLRANTGKQVVLRLNNDDDLACKIVELLEREPETKEVTPAPVLSEYMSSVPPHVAAMSSRRNPNLRVISPSGGETPSVGSSVRELAPVGGDLVVVETTEGLRRVFQVNEIRRMYGAEPLTMKVAKKERVTTRAKRLTMSLGPEAAGRDVSIRLLYFSEGVRWIPTYRLGGELETDGELTLQGEILNEAEPIEGAALDLIVGVPNFRFKTEPSPLTLERTIRRALQRVSPNMFSNAVMTQQVAMPYPDAMGPGGPAVGGLPSLAPELGAEGAMDLFAYSLERFSLGKGGRAAVRLWESTVPVRHLYTLDLRLVRESGGKLSVQSFDAQPPMSPDSPQRLNTNRVWHQLELTNPSSAPWTTGAAFLLKNLLPLGQDLLTYTPPGGKTLLPVTVAVDVTAVYQEEEVERTPNALRWADSNYAMIRQRGSVTMKNSRKEAVTIRPSTTLGGRIDKASDEGRIHIGNFDPGDWNFHVPSGVNNRSNVSWTLTLEPGESRTVTFEYFYYIR